MRLPKYKEGSLVRLKDNAYYINQKREWGGEPAEIIMLDDYSDYKDDVWYEVRCPNGYQNSYPECDLISASPMKNADAVAFLSKEY
jgi:hypothetical protein